MEKKINFYLLETGNGILVASRPKSFDLVLFNEEEKIWKFAPRNYAQMEGDMIYDGGPLFHEISEQEAQDIFKDVRPEPVLDGLR